MEKAAPTPIPNQTPAAVVPPPQVGSFYWDGQEFKPLRVEIATAPGLPFISISGLPDAHIKESHLRLKAAFKACGFKWPDNQKITINLSPTYEKKSSPGVDLAIAAALLYQSGQIVPFENSKPHYFYAELGLSGECYTDPSNLPPPLANTLLVTGSIEHSPHQSVYGIKTLSELHRPSAVKTIDPYKQCRRPAWDPYLEFSPQAAHLIGVVALGCHSLLVAGPQGTGKSTMAKVLHGLMPMPSREKFAQIQKVSRWFSSKPATWRPFVAPHHQSPIKSLIGGSVQAAPGMVTCAHAGVLFLDEFLEFKPEVREALREPIENSSIRIMRLGVNKSYPAQFQLIAATNLCPCGKYKPGYWGQCSYALKKCQSVISNLSGPLLDRFHVVGFSHEFLGKGPKLGVEQILAKVESARAWVAKARSQSTSNAFVNVQHLRKQVDPYALKHLMPDMGCSLRRQSALLQVARSCADLEKSHQIQAKHIEQAAYYTIEPQRELSRALC